MPSVFTHLFVAGALGKTATAEKMPTRFWVLTAVCTLLPDVDIIGFYFGIKYGDVFGHRGFFHSLTFALLVSLTVVFLTFRSVPRSSKHWWGLLAFFFFVTASHGLLDSMTDKGMGVGFFIPFDNTRYFMPWRPVYASPMKISRFFSYSGIEVLTAEIIWIWVPVMLFYAGVNICRKRKQFLPYD
jgi:inner membrane protein